MRLTLTALFLVSSTVFARAAVVAVPEIDGVAGLATIGLIGAVTALIWERGRAK